MGVSQSRNPNLASVFYRLQLVESYGTGIRKIMHLYKEYLRKPEFKAAEGAFSCVLPNSNEEGTYTQKYEYHEDSVGESLNAEKASILYHAKAIGSIPRKEVEDLFGLKTTKAFRLLKELCAEGQLTQQTCGKFTRYIPFGE